MVKRRSIRKQDVDRVTRLVFGVPSHRLTLTDRITRDKAQWIAARWYHRGGNPKAYLLKLAGLPLRCSRCPYDRCLGALEFHHIYGRAGTGPRVNYAGSIKRALAEIQSGALVLLCANCHREQHVGKQRMDQMPRSKDPRITAYLREFERIMTS